MHLYINLFGLTIPAYGFFIALGVVVANILAAVVLKKTKLDINDFIILEAYCFLGGFIGAKLLFFIVSFKDIEWNRITELNYFNALMQGGFVFYGGLIGGILMFFLAGKFHKIEVGPYIRHFVFMIPFVHSFGRVGCFMAGCCYGRPYKGVGAVIYPHGSFAPSGIKLFPVQLVEAALLMIIAIILLILQGKKWEYLIETYLIMYGIVRFLLEYWRYDEVRGVFAGISTSQWISMLLIAAALVSIIIRKRKGHGRFPAPSATGELE